MLSQTKSRCTTVGCLIHSEYSIKNICIFQKSYFSINRVLIEQWIRAKYEREEFCHPERQNHYVSGFMEGFLMKRGKEDSRYHPRKFVLCEAEDTLKYHVKENKVYKYLITYLFKI